MHFPYYLPTYRKSSVQRRQIEPISLFRKARAECRGEKLGPQLLKKVDRDGMSLWDCLRGGKCLYFCVNTRHLHRKAAHVPGIEKMKDLAEESSVSVPPRIGSLKRVYVLPAFPLAISSLLLVDVLREFMKAGIMLDFIKLIRIALKGFRQTVLRANLIALIFSLCYLLQFRLMFCCFQASEQAHCYKQFLFVMLNCFSDSLSRYLQNNSFDNTVRSDWHGSENAEYIFPVAKEDPCFHGLAGTCSNLGKLVYMPMSITTTSLATQFIWITFQFRTVSEFNLLAVFTFSVSFLAGEWPFDRINQSDLPCLPTTEQRAGVIEQKNKGNSSWTKMLPKSVSLEITHPILF